MAKKVTMQQIANYLGVSKFVVSKALSGKGGVSEATKERVIEAAAQLGYYSQRSVSSLSASKPVSASQVPQRQSDNKQTVLVLMPNVRFQTKESLYWGRIIDGISAELERRGIGMVILSEQNSDSLTRFINPEGILGMIGVGEISSSCILDLQHIGITMVLVDHEDELLSLDSVFADNYEATFRLTKQLLSSGRKDVAFVGNIHFSRSFYDRFLGYRAALEGYSFRQGTSSSDKHNKSVEEWMHSGLLNLQGFENSVYEKQIAQWLESLSKLPDAIVCANDAIALTALSVVQNRGIAIPEQLSITGFDNIEDSYMKGFALTTVDVPKEMLGKKAVERLLARLAQPDEPKMKLLVKSDIIYRESTAF